MASSEARIKASQANGRLSKGPVTERGKEISRENSLKHGLTGKGVVLPQTDVKEVNRRTEVYARETGASGEIGLALVHRCALSAVRMERSVDQQAHMLTEQIRLVRDEFVPPEGADDAEAARLRDEACRRAMFDVSPAAILARKYEAAAERTFFRCLKELEKMQKVQKSQHNQEMREIREMERMRPEEDGPPPTEEDFEQLLGSFFPQFADVKITEDEFKEMYAEMGIPLPDWAVKTPQTSQNTRRIDIPISAARPR